ncbi:hypothetical protein [Sulfurimonas sp.]
MRKNLGKLLVLLMFWHVEIFATTYTWSAYSSKNEVYVNEAIYLKYVCEFSDAAELYNIDFNPITDNEKYSVKLLSEHTKIHDGIKISTYEYIAFVKQPMLIEFIFDVIMKKTTKDSIENTVLGRDNVENAEFQTRVIRQRSIKVNVKDSGASLVGEFKISDKSDDVQVKAYEPYHLNIEIKGVGNLQLLSPINFKIDGVKIFSEKPIQKLSLTKDGYVGMWNQKFAFVAGRDFKIPSIDIKYYDINTHSLKSLIVNSKDIKVKDGFKKADLLDEETESKPLDFTFVYYILTFIAGFLFSKIKFKTKDDALKEESLMQKIDKSKSLSELSMVLILNNAKKFNELILSIETKEITSLAEAKKRADKLI